MTTLKLKLFGGFELAGASGPPLPTRKAEALLAYLAVPAGRAHRRDKLAALLWGDRGDAQARHSLAQTLYVIRRTLGESGRDALIVDSRSVTLDPSRVESDVGGFEVLAAEATPVALGKAAALYRDDLLEGFLLSEAGFEDWLLGEQRRLRGLALAALERLLRHRIDALDDGAAIEAARRLLALDPLQEPVHRALMRLHCDAGQKGAAIRQYRACADVLRRELNIEPEPATAALYRAIVTDRARADTVLDPCTPPLFATQKKPTEFRQSFLHRIDLDGDNQPPHARLRWVRVRDANRDWNFATDVGSDAQLATAKPARLSDGFTGKALEFLFALYRWIRPSEQDAAERSRCYYVRILVEPPSMTSSCRNVMLGSMIFPRVIQPR